MDNSKRECSLGWQDLTLSGSTRQSLEDISQFPRNKLNALFAGANEIAKEQSAKVLANHLKLSFYKVNLASVVSKYIGETEVNLIKLNDFISKESAVLFFDEADALFANGSFPQWSSYAFIRRFRFVVDFDN